MRGEGRSAIPEVNVMIASYTLSCGMHVEQVSPTLYSSSKDAAAHSKLQ